MREQGSVGCTKEDTREESDFFLPSPQSHILDLNIFFQVNRILHWGIDSLSSHLTLKFWEME